MSKTKTLNSNIEFFLHPPCLLVLHCTSKLKPEVKCYVLYIRLKFFIH